MSFKTSLRDDLFNAYLDARKNKRNTKAQLLFEIDAEQKLMALHQELVDKTYTPDPAVCFIVHHPVKREVFASQFKDRIVHHLLFNYIAPIFEKKFIHDSYSCRKKRGTLFGIDRLNHHIRSCTDNYTRSAYILKLDIQGYFMNINKQTLYDLISTQLDKHWTKNGVDSEIPSQNSSFVDYLVRCILFKDPTFNCIIRSSLEEWRGLPASKSLLGQPKGIGLPIGDLTSQLFSNIYLDIFDDYVKRTLRIKHYGRYVDDFFMIHCSRRFLKETIPVIQDFLYATLGLKLHPGKIYLQHYTHGVSFLGAFIKPHRIYAGQRSVRQFGKAIRKIDPRCVNETLQLDDLDKIRATLNSYCGYLCRFKANKILRGRLVKSNVLRHYRLIKNFRQVKPYGKYSYHRYKKRTLYADLESVINSWGIISEY